MKTVKFIGTITTVSPVNVSLPSVKGIPKNSHNAYYIPASSLRGMLRSTASHAIAHELAKVDKKLSVDDIYMNFSGVDTGRKVKLGGGYETVNKNGPIREVNPQISVFGNFAIGGNLKVGNAYCSETDSPITKYGNGARNHAFNRQPSLVGFVAVEELDYLEKIMNDDALTSLETSDLKKNRKDLEKSLKTATAEERKAIGTQIDEIDEQIRAAKDARTGSSESILRPLDGFDAIDEGYSLSHRMTLTNPSDKELQYLLWILYKASVNFSVGGHQNLGCGDIHATWKIVESSFDEPTPKTIGELTINDDGFQLTGLNLDAKAIETAIQDGTFNFGSYF